MFTSVEALNLVLYLSIYTHTHLLHNDVTEIETLLFVYYSICALVLPSQSMPFIVCRNPFQNAIAKYSPFIICNSMTRSENMFKKKKKKKQSLK